MTRIPARGDTADGPIARRRKATVVTLSILVAVTLAWLAIGSLLPSPDRSGDSVVVLGDSITALGEEPLRSELGDEYDLTVNGDFGARIVDLVPAAVETAAASPDQVIVNLGTNDVVVGTPLDLAANAIDDLLDALDEVECVHVVTAGQNLISDGVPLPRQAEVLNGVLAEAVQRHSNAELLHWGRAQEAAAIRRDDPGALTFDGVHPDGEGQAVLADAYAGVLGDCGRPWYLS